MGCSNAKELLENKMMETKIKRLEIQMKRFEEIKKLSELVGHKVNYNQIPDYIDPKFAKEHKIILDENINLDKEIDYKEIKEKNSNKKLKSKSSKSSKKIKIKSLN